MMGGHGEVLHDGASGVWAIPFRNLVRDKTVNFGNGGVV